MDLLERWKKFELPPHIVRTLGLPKDWKDTITKEFAEMVVEVALKHKDALRELQKY